MDLACRTARRARIFSRPSSRAWLALRSRLAFAAVRLKDAKNYSCSAGYYARCEAVEALCFFLFFYHLMKQLCSCKNQWSFWEKNLKGLKDKVCGSWLITSSRFQSIEWAVYTVSLLYGCVSQRLDYKDYRIRGSDWLKSILKAV